MNITLREATPDDADFLYRLHRAAMQTYIVQTWGLWDEAWQSLYFHQHFNPSICQIIVVQGKDAGVISIHRRTTDIFLSDIELLPAFQGQGIGTHLITALIAEAQQKSISITLQVLKVNPALKLYERLGFMVNGETATHYLMTRAPTKLA